jgi:molybdenum cofactor biosynthesis enzyme MoaA
MSLSCNHLTNHIAVVSADGIISPCCQFRDYRQPHNYRTIFNTESLNNVLELGFWDNTRTELAKGNKIKNCESCWAVEDANSHSKRIWINSVTKPTDPVRIEDLEIGLDYTCNMMCRICKPSQSSKWNQSKAAQVLYSRRPEIYRKVSNGKEYQDKFKSLLENSDLKHLRRVRLAGGEPFYSKNFDWFIDRISSETDITLVEFAVNTNGSLIPKDTTLEKILQMKKVSIDFSIDAIGDLASCIRWGVKWETVQENIFKWIELAKTHKNIKLSTHSTISILNINKIQELIDFCDTNGIRFGFSTLKDPDYLDFRQLPLDVRKQWTVTSKVLGQFAIDDINKSILSENLVKNKLYEFIYFTEVMDKEQSTLFLDTNSEILNLAEKYKK